MIENSEDVVTRTKGLLKIKTVLLVISAAYLGMLIYWTLEMPFSRQRLTTLFVGASLTIYFLNDLSNALSKNPLGQDWRNWIPVIIPTVALVISLLSSIFVYLDYDAMKTVRVGFMSTPDLIIGTLVIFVVVYATFKEFGRSFGLVVVGFLAYAHLGAFFPSVFTHSGFDLEAIVRITTVGLSGGVWGETVSGVVATWVAVFVIFAGFLEGFGGMEWMKSLGERLSSYVSSGPTQSAIVTSMGFGMISGSGAANTAITGSFTIPMMKDTQHLRGRYAAAIESVASAGGQIMPPVMGAAAFLMADLISVPLSTILVAASLPAVLFYIPLLITAHLVGTGEKWHKYNSQAPKDASEGKNEPVEPIEGPTTVAGTSGTAMKSNESHYEGMKQNLLISGLPFYLPIIILVYLLVVAGRGVMITGVYTIAATLAIGVIATTYRIGFGMDAFTASVTSIVDGLISGMETSAKIGIVGASIGMVVAIIDITAIAQRVGLILLEISGGNFELLLLLTAGLAIVLGMGAPPVAAYLITVIILAPTIVESGVPEIQAHFFVFYFAILSYITPPIAIGVAIASNIANSDFMATAKEAVKMGLPLYIVPFTFIYYDLITANVDWIATLPRLVFLLIALSLLPFVFYSSFNRRTRLGILFASAIMLTGGVFVF